MKRASSVALLSGLLWSASVLAQPAPRGPADLIGGARRARDARDLEQAAERGTSAGKKPEAAAPDDAHEPLADAEAAPPGGPHAGLAEDAPERIPIATERPDAALPVGSIRVHVVDVTGAPIPAAAVSIGVMEADGKRSTRDAKTTADGSVTVQGLAAGERQAYRVNVPFQGAKYSSVPFRLPPDSGYDVTIRRLPVTRDDRMVVLYLGATSLELKDDRVKVVQEARLLNIGSQTYVFPDAGALVHLPKGFMAVQTQESMTDQHLAEAAGQGLRVSGSLAPGEATLLWGFDLPLAGTDLSFAVDIPWTTFAYRVIADAPPGLTLAVADMPEPMVHADSGRRFWVTETQRKIGEAPFRRLSISLHGIPGPGPERWIAAGLALLVLSAGVALRSRFGESASARQTVADFEARKAAVIARARELQSLRAVGEAGPEYHAEQMLELTDELATMLFEQAQAKLKEAASE